MFTFILTQKLFIIVVTLKQLCLPAGYFAFQGHLAMVGACLILMVRGVCAVCREARDSTKYPAVNNGFPQHRVIWS